MAHVFGTEKQSREIERIQKRSPRTILPRLSDEKALGECNLNALESQNEGKIYGAGHGICYEWDQSILCSN